MTITRARRPSARYEPPLISWEGYLRWALCQELPSEWVDGEIVEIMPGNLRHQLIVRLLSELLNRLAERHRLGW